MTRCSIPLLLIYTSLFLLLLTQHTTQAYNTTFGTFAPTQQPTEPTETPTNIPSTLPSQTPSTKPTQTFYPTKAPFLSNGRDTNHTAMPSTMPIAPNTPTQAPNCDSDWCNHANLTAPPSNYPTVSPTEENVIDPTSMPTAPTMSPVMEPTSVPTVIQGASQKDDKTTYAWDDPIVVAVGLLGFLVLILTGMVTIFACMAYTRSKDNIKITERLKAQFMADNSHSNDSQNANNNSKGNGKPRKFNTDYRNVGSTDAFMVGGGAGDGDGRVRGDTDVPGSMKSQSDNVLEVEEEVLIEMGKNDSKKNNNNNTKGAKANAAPRIAGESEPENARLGVSVVNNNNANSNVSVTPGGPVSTDEVMRNIQGEGANSLSEKKPGIKLLSGSLGDSNNNNGDFLKGLNDVAAQEDAIEDDIIAHMATAGNNDGNNGGAQGNNANSIQLQYGD